MSGPGQHRDPVLPLDVARTIDRICDAFETQWISGGRPAIEDHLCGVDDAARPALLRELILIDSHYRRQEGERPDADLYAQRFPEVAVDWLAAVLRRTELIPFASAAQNDGMNSVQQENGVVNSVVRKNNGMNSVLQRNFGDYELLEEVARGGMGVVYKARQVSLNRIVAVKMILSGLQASPADVERFHAEAEAAANLDHPGIVPIFEVGECQGQHWFSMGYVEGRSLADRLAEGPLPPRQAAQLLHDVCEAVEYAHQHRVIHRDLKPANILLDHEGRPRITDFGLAKCLSDDAGRTTTGQMLGTPSYIPPEQAAGKLALIGPAADIYALGAVLYALLTGRPPFHAASSVDTLRQVIDNEPLPPRALAPGTPRDLETIALKCLQKAIAQRYPAVRDLADDLQRFLDGRPILARPISRWEHAWRWCRRNPYLAALSAAVLLLLALIAVISTTAAFQYRAQLARAEAATRAEDLAKQEALAKLWDSYLVAARAGRISRRPGQRFASLRAVEAALALPLPRDRSQNELRTEAIAALMLPDLEEFKQWPGFPKETLGVAIDPTFQRYARGAADGRVSVRRVADDVELFQLPATGPLKDFWGLAFSGDGGCLMQCCQSSQGLRRHIWKLGTPPTLALTCNEVYDFSPDGHRLATVDNDGSVRLYDLGTGRQQCRYQLAGFVPAWLAWNPRRPLLMATAADRKSYRLLDVESGKFGPAISVPSGIELPVWHPEGRLLAIVGMAPNRCRIYLVQADSGAAEMPPLEAHRIAGVAVRFNHYGDRLLSTDWSGLWRLWDVRTGQLLLTQPAGGNELHFRDDDRLVGIDFSTRGLRLFRCESGREVCKVVHRAKSVAIGYADPDTGTCQLDPEGRLLALPAADGIAVVDVVRGEDVGLLPQGREWPVRTDPSGALLTFGTAGLRRWPLNVSGTLRVPIESGTRSVPDTLSRVYGPPECLATVSQLFDGSEQGRSRPTAADRNAEAYPLRLAFPNFDRGASELLLPEGRRIRLGPQEDVRHCAVSPDGRWVATGSHSAVKGSAAMIWDASTGRHLLDLPVTSFCCVAFSPDGNWLMTTGGGARLWSVGDWKEGPNLGPAAPRGVFSADGNLLALEEAPGVVRLVLPADGKELARLTVLDTVRLQPLCFTRDAMRLVCRAGEEESLYIFNLGLIRAQLAVMGLDWDAPPCPVESGRLPPPLTVEFVGEKR